MLAYPGTPLAFTNLIKKVLYKNVVYKLPFFIGKYKTAQEHQRVITTLYDKIKCIYYA
jgi:hypothetical protein